MKWQDIYDNPLFNDLPFKLESDRWGHIVMSPASNQHSWLQGEIAFLLRRYRQGGMVLPECSIQTAQGVKVADVVWAGKEFFRRNRFANPYPESPEIVVEVLSPSTSKEEMEEKKALYFECGASEFWLCEKNGSIRFYGQDGSITVSRMVPDFPNQLKLPLSSTLSD
ncbi:MAG: Uma2 family endonuclease [Methylococcaceae bacterium]